MTGKSTMDSWARFTPQQRMKRYGSFLVVALIVAWSLRSIDVIWEWVWDAPIQLFDLFDRMVPADPRLNRQDGPQNGRLLREG